MPFVEPCVAHGDQQGEGGPPEIPTLTLRADPMKHGNAENAKFRDMGEFADGNVRQAQFARGGEGKNPVK